MAIDLRLAERKDHEEHGNRIERASGIQAAGTSMAPLLEHLDTILDHVEVQEVIQLLRDIRDHQDHDDMKQAFKEHDHALAHGVKNHSNDILELLVKDYLAGPDVDLNEESASHQKGLELHVKYVVISALKGYHDVVKGIRNDVSGLAQKLKEDASVKEVRDLISHLKEHSDEGAVQNSIQKIPTSDSMHHFFNDEGADDPHHAMAKAAYRAGHQDHEAAARFIGEDLHVRLSEHFEDALAPPQSNKNGSGTYEIRAKLDEIQEARVNNRRVNAAYTLLENLPELSQLHKGSPLATDDHNQMAERVVELAGLYVRSQSMRDSMISNGLLKIEQAKVHRQALKGEAGRSIPPSCSELWTILDDERDLVPALTELWLEKDWGNIEAFNDLLKQVASHAQGYIDPELFKSTIPADTPKMSDHELYFDRLRKAPFESTAWSLCRVLGAASSNSSHPQFQTAIKNSAELCDLIGRFSRNGLTNNEAIVDAYMEVKDHGYEGNFNEYLENLLGRLRRYFDSDFFEFLLTWSNKPTLRVPLAPPSQAPIPKIPPLPALGQVVPVIPSESVVIREMVASVPEGETYVVEANHNVEIYVALEGSTIEVKSGGTLRLFSADDNVTIKLKDKTARAKIERVSELCRGLRIEDENGDILTEAQEYLELGEGVQEKLSF